MNEDELGIINATTPTDTLGVLNGVEQEYNRRQLETNELLNGIIQEYQKKNHPFIYKPDVKVPDHFFNIEAPKRIDNGELPAWTDPSLPLERSKDNRVYIPDWVFKTDNVLDAIEPWNDNITTGLMAASFLPYVGPFAKAGSMVTSGVGALIDGTQMGLNMYKHELTGDRKYAGQSLIDAANVGLDLLGMKALKSITRYLQYTKLPRFTRKVKSKTNASKWRDINQHNREVDRLERQIISTLKNRGITTGSKQFQKEYIQECIRRGYMKQTLSDRTVNTALNLIPIMLHQGSSQINNLNTTEETDKKYARPKDNTPSSK